MDGDFSYNVAGLVNHSCDANARYDGKGLKVWITADRDIKKGEEITCDYGFSFDKNDYKQFPCKCGSKNCCGWIIGEQVVLKLDLETVCSQPPLASIVSRTSPVTPSAALREISTVMQCF